MLHVLGMESLRHHWGFLDATLDPGSAFVGTYEPTFVILSIVVASLAAYAALGLAERIGAADKPLAKRAWLAVGAVTMGVGVWAMHFLGMLAYRVPVRVNYDIWVLDPAHPERPLRITSNASWDDCPAWDPGGAVLYFRSNRGGEWGIWKINLK